MVEYQLPKLVTRVRFPSPAPPVAHDVVRRYGRQAIAEVAAWSEQISPCHIERHTPALNSQLNEDSPDWTLEVVLEGGMKILRDENHLQLPADGSLLMVW